MPEETVEVAGIKPASKRKKSGASKKEDEDAAVVAEKLSEAVAAQSVPGAEVRRPDEEGVPQRPTLLGLKLGADGPPLASIREQRVVAPVKWLNVLQAPPRGRGGRGGGRGRGE